MTNTTNAALTHLTITRSEVEAVREHALTTMTGRNATETVDEMDRALQGPFSGEEHWSADHLTRTAIRTRGLAAKILNELRAAGVN